ncbi:putative CAAX protease self-immunity family protein [Alphaproteobacteria bacterium]
MSNFTLIALTYVCLVFTIISIFSIRAKKVINYSFALTLLMAVLSNTITVIGLCAILLLCFLRKLLLINDKGISILGIIKLSSAVRKLILFAILLLISLFILLHIIPVFRNYCIFENLQLSEYSALFSLCLKFDQAILGILLSQLYDNRPISKYDICLIIKMSVVCVITLSIVAVSARCLALDPKFPKIWWIWVVNNLFFVCFLEETIFRGIIQQYLTILCQKYNLHACLPILFISLIFGMAHLRSGVSYALLATLAGLFYGYTYYKTNSVLLAILVHFFSNTFHFFVLTYPLPL